MSIEELCFGALAHGVEAQQDLLQQFLCVQLVLGFIVLPVLLFNEFIEVREDGIVLGLETGEGGIVADVLDGCGDNLQVTYSDNWKRIINGDLAGGKNGTCKQSIACRKIKALGGTDNCVCTLIVPPIFEK